MEEAQRLLEDQQRRAESLRNRGGQIAGFGAAVLALTTGNAAAILGAAEGSARAVIGMTLVLAVGCLAVAVVVAIWGVMRPQPFVAPAADEITIFTSGRFLTESDLWRVHLRSLRALEKATRQAEKEGDIAAKAILNSMHAFLLGLGFSLISLGTLVFELI